MLTDPHLPRGTAVVTGVAGFIGSHLAGALLARGYRVTGIDSRSPFSDDSALANLRGILDRHDFTFAQADLRTADVQQVVTGADMLFHLAGIPGVRSSWGERFADYLACNVLTTDRLMRSCHEAGVPRVVIASSSSVYGEASSAASSEETCPSPLSPYAVSKLAAEQLSLAHAACRGAVTSVIALRYFTVYGPRQRDDMLLARAIRSAVDGEPLVLYGDGRQRRDFTFVEDVVAATLAAGEVIGPSSVINVGSGGSVTVSDALRMVQEATGRPVNTLVKAQQDGDSPATLADISKARDLLGWRPRVPLAEGILRQFASMFPEQAAAQPLTPSVRRRSS
jgi:UDP-glucuronate 4-epimerase